MLAGLTAPAAGEIRWRQHVMRPFDARLRGAVAFNGHLPALKDELTAEENLVQWIALDDRLPAPDVVAEALDEVALGRQRRLPVRVLSQGQRRRIGLARLRLVERPLWILDEPLTALDADGVDVLRALLAAHSTAAAFASRRRTSRCRYRERRERSLALGTGASRMSDRPPGHRRSERAACGQRDAQILGADGRSAGRWRRDCRVALRSKAELGVQLLFYVIVVSLFPLAASPSRELLATIGPGVLWTAALLASLLSLSRLFACGLRRRNARADGAVAAAAGRRWCPVK